MLVRYIDFFFWFIIGIYRMFDIDNEDLLFLFNFDIEEFCSCFFILIGGGSWS